MKRALVLGAGMVGSVMARDLADDPGFQVSIADQRDEALARAAALIPGVETIKINLADPIAVTTLAREYDIVLGALASVIGFQTLRAVIESGTNFCDICFMPENAMELDALAREHGVTAVVDCGVAPGMSNILTGYAHAQLDETHDVRIYVGGIPMNRDWPYEYKAGFSPYDVIEEYTRPARVVVNGKTIEKEALSEIEEITFEGVGTLEAFITDGLRSLADTIPAPNMVEKTMRYPGHAEMMRVFRHTGFFSHEPIAVGADGVKVRPIDLTSALLFPKWTYEPGEADLTVMRVIVEGVKDGRRTRYTWDLSDRFDSATQTTSMSRTTAFPCAIMARQIISGAFHRPGVNPPEFVGREAGMLEHLLKELQTRGIRYDANVEYPS